MVGAGRFVFNTRPPTWIGAFPADAWNNPSRWDLTGLDTFVQRWTELPRRTGTSTCRGRRSALWFGDNWRLSDRLTVNYGVRWDADFGVADPPGIPETTILIDNGR